MKLYIPAIGDEIVLTNDWSFTVHPEKRNIAMYAHLGWMDMAKGLANWGFKGTKVSAVLPAGTVLKIERLYIRKDQGEFDSITFIISDVKIDVPYEDRQYNTDSAVPVLVTKIKSRPLRFWVKLEDANTIQFTPK